MKTQQSEYNNKTFRGAVQRDSNVVGERFWRDFSFLIPPCFYYLTNLVSVLCPGVSFSTLRNGDLPTPSSPLRQPLLPRHPSNRHPCIIPGRCAELDPIVPRRGRLRRAESQLEGRHRDGRVSRDREGNRP